MPIHPPPPRPCIQHTRIQACVSFRHGSGANTKNAVGSSRHSYRPLIVTSHLRLPPRVSSHIELYWELFLFFLLTRFGASYPALSHLGSQVCFTPSLVCGHKARPHASFLSLCVCLCVPQPRDWASTLLLSPRFVSFTLSPALSQEKCHSPERLSVPLPPPPERRSRAVFS